VTALRARAPGKVNLCLFVGAPRADGLHPLVSVVQPVSLADELTLEPAAADEVVCLGVDGPNLAAAALAAFREATGWREPQLLTIDKRVPVAAGMGGGSADAAATLRLAAHAAGIAPPPELAFALGADVPAQLEPRRALMLGAGERVEALPEPEPFGLVILPLPHALSTADVYREFDRLGHGRPPDELARLEGEARRAPPPVNDLDAAARSLCPAIDDGLAAMRGAGAQHAMVSGSGPTVFGVFDTALAARAAATRLKAIAAEPVGPDFAAVRPA
jgi:4-diphosphocytidyl-2-C-methyl-D-erythritol kinase